MDRNSFLESLPFLVPCSSSSSTTWPLQPPITHLQQEEDEPLLLSKHQLSIEPLLSSSLTSSASESNNKNMGVAFFEADRSSNLANKDPALTPCELALSIVRRRNNANNNSSETRMNVRRPLSISPGSGGSVAAGAGGLSLSLLSPASTRQQEAMIIVSLSMKINDRVYYVNWTRLTEVQSVEQESLKENAAAKPPCLLLYFPSCLFRIFSLDVSSSAAPSTNSVVDQYNAFRDVIHGVLTELSSPSSPSSSVIVPALSDHSFEALSSASPKSSSPNSTNSSSGGRSNERESAALDATRFQHQQHALRQCHDEFSSLWTLLLMDQPLGTRLPSNLATKKSSLGRDITSLMTTVAQDLATSLGGNGGDDSAGAQDYDSASYIVNQSRRLEEQLQVTQKKMETALNDFFPAPRISKRKNVSGEQTLEQVQELMQQHKRILRERHPLLSLPTRM